MSQASDTDAIRFTRFPNPILDRLAAFPLTAREYRVLLVVVRLTSGYNRGMMKLDPCQIARMCDLRNQQVRQAMDSLLAKAVVICHGDEIGINDPASWGDCPKAREGCHAPRRTEEAPRYQQLGLFDALDVQVEQQKCTDHVRTVFNLNTSDPGEGRQDVLSSEPLERKTKDKKTKDKTVVGHAHAPVEVEPDVTAFDPKAWQPLPGWHELHREFLKHHTKPITSQFAQAALKQLCVELEVDGFVAARLMAEWATDRKQRRLPENKIGSPSYFFRAFQDKLLLEAAERSDGEKPAPKPRKLYEAYL